MLDSILTWWELLFVNGLMDVILTIDSTRRRLNKKLKTMKYEIVVTIFINFAPKLHRESVVI